MKIKKLEKIQKGDYPIIRVTYKTWYGKLVIKDVCKPLDHHLWTFMDSGNLVLNDEAINTFNESDNVFYFVNGFASCHK